MKLTDKVNIVYNISHGLSNSDYSKSEINSCKKYRVSYGDSRATKKNITLFIKAKDLGYKKDFDDYCKDNNYADGRKNRNGKDAWENDWRSHGLEIGLMCFVLFCALEDYGNMILFLPLVALVIIIWKVLGKRRALIFSFLFFIAYCYFSYYN